MIIDSNKELILIGEDKKVINGLRRYAENLKHLTHYTTRKNFTKLLLSSELRMNSQDSIYSENAFDSNQNSNKTNFISCFTEEIIESNLMWESFGDHLKGVKVDLYFNNNIYDIINFAKPFNCYKGSELQAQIAGFNNEISSLFSFFGNAPTDGINSEMYKCNVHADTLIIKITNDYEKAQNVSAINIEGEEYKSLNEISRHGIVQYAYQNEIRLIVSLRATKEIYLNDFNYLHVPLDLTKLKKIIITLGSHMSEQSKFEINKNVENNFKNIEKELRISKIQDISEFKL